jgi:hypothetical protein
MKSRTEIVCRGWLYALPYVLTAPVIFWLLIAPTQMIAWSWSGLLNIYQYGLPLIGLSVLAHTFAFLIFGFPLFLVFWARRSKIWHFPVSISIGLLIGVVVWIGDYVSSGFPHKETFVVSFLYGVSTAVGCWIANRRSEQGEAGQAPLAALSSHITSNLNTNSASNARPR